MTSVDWQYHQHGKIIAISSIAFIVFLRDIYEVKQSQFHSVTNWGIKSAMGMKFFQETVLITKYDTTLLSYELLAFWIITFHLLELVYRFISIANILSITNKLVNHTSLLSGVDIGGNDCTKHGHLFIPDIDFLAFYVQEVVRILSIPMSHVPKVVLVLSLVVNLKILCSRSDICLVVKLSIVCLELTLNHSGCFYMEIGLKL